jgi:UDP-N-acetylglucosamine enolpyruvyl transferase
MDRIRIEGGHCLSGEITVSGSKNAALPQMVACLLAGGTSTLRNIPDLRDVQTMADVLRSLGAGVEFVDGRVRIDARGFANAEAIVGGEHHGTVLFRLSRESRAGYVRLTELFLKRVAIPTVRGSVIVVSPDAIRIRRLT